MEVDRLGPGERRRTEGKATVPRQAASVMVVRGGAQTLEVLLVRRTEAARFMAGVWVFPGGAVDAEEGDGDAAHRLAALRELREEAGITLRDPDSLVKFSRWITPAELVIRFDTHFFLAAPADPQEPEVDGEEIVACAWFQPAQALAAHARGELPLVFPTIKHLEQLAVFDNADALLAYARRRRVTAVQPRVVDTGEVARIVMPGEPGYDDA